MLIKAADDKFKRIVLLEDLQQSSHLGTSQKKWLRDELHRFKKGLQGERESAFYLDSHFKDSPNHAVIHDLRLVFEGEVAQIDHLVFGRAGLVYLIETKNYSGNLIVNSKLTGAKLESKLEKVILEGLELRTDVFVRDADQLILEIETN